MYNSKPVLDIHGHVSAPMHGTTALGLMLAANTDLGFDPRQSLPALGLTEQSWEQSVKAHIHDLDIRSIDAQLIGPRPFLMLGWMNQHVLEGWTRFVNNAIAKQVEMAPDRFVGACQLPQNAHDGDLSGSVAELDRCVNELGFKGVYLSPDPTGDRKSPGMDTAYWYPIYERCQHYGIPIVVHGSNCMDPRIKSIPHNYQIGFVWEQYLATQLFSHGDVFDRFPDLKVVICHCGGALDRWIKSDHHLSQRDTTGNLYFDTNAPDLNFLEAAIKQRTPKQLCFGTEAPGSGRAVRPETGRPGDDLVPVISSFDFLSEADKHMIFHENPAHVCPGLGELGGCAHGSATSGDQKSLDDPFAFGK
ncbi:amidohydrolase family protein [Novosphingobium sp.]|jgi:predicted TIM-barrel fold metal-dependent hydrolase|uniref:amidohydrolase family protein n=1 Tax=Novosphingobium sp. TaxID=1874826 RepID=UPI0022C0831F|nr:amidohydrolase family protein [Novosphingobium sp.]MCZ8018659.1 amidohydrolase family protein [Novosphingobium sp.]MCZ8034664.1 amidohydrolase family protein [Novosphingobium sp.]MCZ8052799.1 amidohydrolase family protein [Novosphingobium sp.]MCZ8060557.1 amidohydrolase family protein [Novosphingobium sp.]MCZ8230583.1 amidohydrolase family protein [Novosphingobium sp.]